jgi:hypothetical protein
LVRHYSTGNLKAPTKWAAIMSIAIASSNLTWPDAMLTKTAQSASNCERLGHP